MNIFVLDLNPKLAAKYHNNKHCVKMILEYAQLLSTTHHLLNSAFKDELYKPTHKNHPCTKWVMESSTNYLWLYDLYTYLADEYELRYNKIHKSYDTKAQILSEVPESLVDNGLTVFKLCMPEHCKVYGNAVESYRNYYKQEKRHIADWKIETPYWWL
jgi:hypothetical protein